MQKWKYQKVSVEKQQFSFLEHIHAGWEILVGRSCVAPKQNLLMEPTCSFLIARLYATICVMVENVKDFPVRQKGQHQARK